MHSIAVLHLALHHCIYLSITLIVNETEHNKRVHNKCNSTTSRFDTATIGQLIQKGADDGYMHHNHTRLLLKTYAKKLKRVFECSTARLSSYDHPFLRGLVSPYVRGLQKTINLTVFSCHRTNILCIRFTLSFSA